jgi:hypothetical protein
VDIVKSTKEICDKIGPLPPSQHFPMDSTETGLQDSYPLAKRRWGEGIRTKEGGYSQEAPPKSTTVPVTQQICVSILPLEHCRSGGCVFPAVHPSRFFEKFPHKAVKLSPVFGVASCFAARHAVPLSSQIPRSTEGALGSQPFKLPSSPPAPPTGLVFSRAAAAFEPAKPTAHCGPPYYL